MSLPYDWSMPVIATNPEGRITLGFRRTDSCQFPTAPDILSARTNPRSVVQMTSSFPSTLFGPNASSMLDGVKGMSGAIYRTSRSQDVMPSPIFLFSCLASFITARILPENRVMIRSCAINGLSLKPAVTMMWANASAMSDSKSGSCASIR